MKKKKIQYSELEKYNISIYSVRSNLPRMVKLDQREKWLIEAGDRDGQHLGDDMIFLL